MNRSNDDDVRLLNEEEQQQSKTIANNKRIYKVYNNDKLILVTANYHLAVKILTRQEQGKLVVARRPRVD